MLTDNHETSEVLKITSQAGVLSTNKQGWLEGNGKVWFDLNEVANILLLSNVERQNSVIYDSENGDSFEVTTSTGVTRKFQHSEIGLYCYNTKDDQVGAVFVATVADRMANYTARDILQAKQARTLQMRLGYPSTTQFKAMLAINMQQSCPVTVGDVDMAEDIFGPSLGIIKGKSIRQKTPVVDDQYVMVPTNLPDKYKFVTLSIDVMFVNKISIPGVDI
jgi:hypothetical protein